MAQGKVRIPGDSSIFMQINQNSAVLMGRGEKHARAWMGCEKEDEPLGCMYLDSRVFSAKRAAQK